MIMFFNVWEHPTSDCVNDDVDAVDIFRFLARRLISELPELAFREFGRETWLLPDPSDRAGRTIWSLPYPGNSVKTGLSEFWNSKMTKILHIWKF